MFRTKSDNIPAIREFSEALKEINIPSKYIRNRKLIMDSVQTGKAMTRSVQNPNAMCKPKFSPLQWD